LPLLRMRALTYTGLISYALYLLHQPLRLIIERGHHDITTSRDVVMTLIALAAVFVVSALSWELFEKPLVRRGHQYRYAEGNLDTPLSAS
jgi:peptidoglycan/LPS O-acetylase OafA/YrhL